jgi:hypothetical protein
MSTSAAIRVYGSGGSPFLGNVATVDAVFGNDGTATVNGLPFKTVNAAVNALAAYGSPGTVWILPGSYTVTPFTIPAGCSIRGLSLQTVVLTCTAPAGGGTTFVTMGENTRLEDCQVILLATDATATPLVAIGLPGTTSVTSKIRTCVVTVDNHTVAAGDTTNVYGLYSNGTGSLSAGTFSFNVIKGSTINVKSNGGGNKYGIYQPAGDANQMSTRDLNIYVAAPPDPLSTGRYIGIFTDNANSQIQIRSTSVYGPEYQQTTKYTAVRIAVKTNLSLTGALTTQGVTLANGDRVLATGQSTPSQNGIYVVNTAGAWTRAADMAAGANANGAWVPIAGGDYALQSWLCTAAGVSPGFTPTVNGPFIVGTNGLTFQFNTFGYETKIPVRVLATANTGRSGLLTIDGVTLSAGDRVLCTAETSGVNNGIYVAASGAWTRSGDFPANANALNAYVVVTGGSTHANTAWQCTTTGTVGTASLSFSQRYLGASVLQNAPQAGNLTNGIQVGPGSDLIGKSCAGQPFSTYVYPTSLVYGLKGNGVSGTRYLWPGIQTAGDATEVFYRLQQDAICQGISMNARGAPGTDTATVTVRKSWSGLVGTGVDTPISVTWTDGILQLQDYNHGIEFKQGEFLSLSNDNTGGISPFDLSVEVDLF